MQFAPKLVFFTVAALGILIYIGGLSYRKTIQEDADQSWVAHTHSVINLLNSIEQDLIDAEAGQQSYIGTNDKESQQRFQTSAEDAKKGLILLRQLTSDNAVQQHAVDVLEPQIVAQLNNLQSSTTIADQADQKGLERIRKLISDMQDEEELLRKQRLTVAARSSSQLKLVIVAGNLLAIILFCATAMIIHSEFNKRSLAERTLRQSEERFRLLVSGVKDYAILMLDPDGHVMSWNEGAERIKGYRSEEIIGKNFSLFFPPEDIDIGKPLRELQTAKEKGAFEEENWRVRKDGSRFWANIVITALRDGDGRLRGFGKVTRDMTERKRSEEQIRLQNTQLAIANKELESFSYSVSHDLRAPLRSIDGFSQALLDDCADKLDEDGAGYLRRIRAATQRMGVLIDDLLNLSRMARVEINKERIDLSAMASSIAMDLQKNERERTVGFLIQPGVEAHADSRLLRLVLENLLNNAWKFTSKRNSACIEFGSEEINGSCAYFVRDDGAGFDQAYAPKLFGAFQRLHALADFPGTGIGLATVQRIIQKHGGKIWASGAVDQGATFYFTLI